LQARQRAVGKNLNPSLKKAAAAHAFKFLFPFMQQHMHFNKAQCTIIKIGSAKQHNY
jgi:hypothetical protein